ncbi:thymidylate kinase-domain-containing protein [Xylaria sp. CBS 124048]|nr:thymidylate kinase-domain-containing protein [Xylaria sp. CBS 124048]
MPISTPGADNPDPGPDPYLDLSLPSTAVASTPSPAPEYSGRSETVNAGASVAGPNTPTPSSSSSSSSSSQGPVLTAPQISLQNPAHATIPPQATSKTAEVKTGEKSSLEADDDMVDVDEPRQPPVRGAFIVFEGMDRAGKTTQAKLLQLRCIESGRQVRFMRFPDRTTTIGQMIDSYLKGESTIDDHVIHLLFSANRWEAAEKIKSELAAGHTIICDRFYHSGIVYSAAKQLPSLSLSWAKAPEVGLPRPDMVLFLDLEESVARARGGWGGEVYEKGEMQRRVRELFWGLSMGDLGSAAGKTSTSAADNGGGHGNGSGNGKAKEGVSGNGMSSSSDVRAGSEGEFRQEEEDIQIVDADLGVEELAEKVWEVVRGRLEAVERGEEGKSVRIVR